MLNEPDNEPKRKLHPLERKPEPAPEPDQEQQTRQRAMLHIPVAKPQITYALIAVNAVVYFIAFFVMSPAEQFDFYRWGANNHSLALEEGQIYRLFSAMFLHSEVILHIFFNMYALYIIGSTVERFFGHVRFALVYFLGGLGGSILSVLLNGPNVYSVGASGAVFAIFGAEMVFIYKHRRLFGEMGRAQLRQLIIVAGINFVFGFATTVTPGGINIDNWGHIGGFVGGIALAWMIGPVFLLERHPSREGAFQTIDINPLERQVQPVLAYISVMLILLIIGSAAAQGYLSP